MKKNIIVILDPAHGADVAGKCSPDGKHREFRWSRDRIKSLRSLLVNMGYEVYQTTESENEPGLSKRKNFATQIKKGSRKLLLSLHNNAKGSDSKWHDAQGTCVYTTRGVTNSDICADFIINRFEKDFPNVRIRKYNVKKLEKDFESNLTVLMGSDYMGVLVEWLFQDNKDDVKKLQDSEINRHFEISIVKAIEEINDYFK